MKQQGQRVTVRRNPYRRTKWFEDDAAAFGLPGWKVAYRLVIHPSGVSVFAAIRVRPADAFGPVPGIGLTSRMLRRIRLPGASVLKDVRKRESELRATTQKPAPTKRAKRGRGRPRLSIRFYKKLAKRVEALENAGATGNKSKRVLEREYPNMSRTALRSAIWRCRYVYKLLSPTARHLLASEQ